MPDLPNCPYRPYGGVSSVRSPSPDGGSANALPTWGSASVVRLSKSVRATRVSAQMSSKFPNPAVPAVERAGFRSAEWGSRWPSASMGRADG